MVGRRSEARTMQSGIRWAEAGRYLRESSTMHSSSASSRTGRTMRPPAGPPLTPPLPPCPYRNPQLPWTETRSRLRSGYGSAHKAENDPAIKYWTVRMAAKRSNRLGLTHGAPFLLSSFTTSAALFWSIDLSAEVRRVRAWS